ncbi:hypothetical protein BDW22DRAFT_1481243 [Trametopsis cervina]|nr:hypothetical protein BDW22DRAFT_1481243 [Trametopsis cervina]
MSPVVPLQPLQITSTVTRSNSIKSTNSANSAVSLRRRSRTRTRALTDLGRRGKSTGPGGSPKEDASSGKGVRTETSPKLQLERPPLPTRLPQRTDSQLTETPPAVQELVIPSVRERTYSAVHIRDVPDLGRGRLAHSEGGSTRNVARKSRGKSLPRGAFRNAASSDESSEASPRTPTDFPEAPFIRFPRRNPRAAVRDSLISSSSSLYPASTSSGSFPESSVLLSPNEKDDEMSSFAPRIVTSSDFDVDDVSYRLRLLVNNNYFLPPAHHKPSPLSLTPQNPVGGQKAAKPAAPGGFFDFFRMGKSKSKPTTPICMSPPALDNPPPLLRTTSDSTTAGGYVQRPNTAPATETTSGQPFSSASANQSRVVVLRERMDDLMEAAKQAERDMKSRGDGRKAKSLTSPKPTFDDVIDPTDAVDLPMSSSAYPFPVQTSAMHGLGPGESLGADLLADRLPPSPGQWSMSTEEASWRKAILHEAVSLSLSESPENSFSSTPSSPNSSSPKSFRVNSNQQVEEPSSPPTPKPTTAIGQRIIEPLELDAVTQTTTALSPLSGLQALPTVHSADTAEQGDEAWRASLNPPRAETPAMTQPLTPPPPRKELARPHHSLSSDDLHRSISMDSERPQADSMAHVIRRAMSSPRLSHGTESGSNSVDSIRLPESIQQRLSAISPPLDIQVQDMGTVSSRPSTISLLRPSASAFFSDDDDLSYATPMDEMDDETHGRPSMTLSIPSIGRPSMSDYSNPSPTASAFHDAMMQDAVFGSCRAPSPMRVRRSHPGSISPGVSPSTSSGPAPPVVARHLTMSPPPRTSSSLGTVLPPPPRSPAIKPVYRPSTSSSRTSHAASTYPSSPLYPTREHRPEVETDLPLSRNPSTDRSPTSPLAERRGQPSPLSLHIPTEVISPAIHSAPAPASPTAFFDRIQSHPNAMDDLETSDESDEEEVEVEPPAPAPTMPPPSPGPSSYSGSPVKGPFSRSSGNSSRPSIMRLGNHSTPHLTASNSSQEVLFPTFDVPDPRKPIGNIPEKGTFFTARSRKKSGKGYSPYPLPLPADSASIAAGLTAPGPSGHGLPARTRSISRPSTASGGSQAQGRTWRRESVLKLDGMLLEHMAAERDTIKRITSNISSSRS